MPTNVKIIVSILVVLVALVAFYFEHQTGAGSVKWVILGLGAFMAVSLWIFPEPKVKERDSTKKDRP